MFLCTSTRLTRSFHCLSDTSPPARYQSSFASTISSAETKLVGLAPKGVVAGLAERMEAAVKAACDFEAGCRD